MWLLVAKAPTPSTASGAAPYDGSSLSPPLAGAALKMLPDHDVAVTAQINRALRTQLDPEMLSSEDRAYIDAVAAAA